MLKKILVLDGVVAVCRFQDDGTLIEGEGLLPAESMSRLAHFAQWYRRMVSGNTDLLSLFSQMTGWTPSHGWVVRGDDMTVCGVTNLVCMVENGAGSLNEVMRLMEEASHE